MNLELLSRKRTYYEETAPSWVRKIWSRPQAFDHFIKYHRAALVDQGALIKIGRDHFVVSDKFPNAATAILGFELDASTGASHVPA
jgi:hypothetical protein